jgi:hypothetical protein
MACSLLFKNKTQEDIVFEWYRYGFVNPRYSMQETSHNEVLTILWRSITNLGSAVRQQRRPAVVVTCHETCDELEKTHGSRRGVVLSEYLG